MVQPVMLRREGKEKVGADTDEEGGEKDAGKRCRWTTWHHEKKQGKKEKNRKENKATYSLDWDIPLPRYTSTFIALIAKCPRSPHPYFWMGNVRNSPIICKSCVGHSLSSFYIHQTRTNTWAQGFEIIGTLFPFPLKFSYFPIKGFHKTLPVETADSDPNLHQLR